jgi:hypothetical protein
VDDLDELAVWLGTCLRGLASWGLGPGTRLAGIGSPSPLHISNQLYAVLLAGQPSAAPRLAVTTPLPEMVDALNAFPPQALTAYPTVAAALAEEQLQGRLRIAPTLVATTSEVQTADMRRRMTQAWGLEPLDFYGTTEAAVVAAARQGQAGMDILEDLVVVEVVDEHDRPVPPGVAGHKVLLSNLVNRVQPLLRYELTDSVTLAGGPNPLGLPYARIAAVDGRSDDLITLPGPAAGRSPSTRSSCGPPAPSGSRSRSPRSPGSSATPATGPSSSWSAAGRRPHPDRAQVRVTTLTIRPGTWTTLATRSSAARRATGGRARAARRTSSSAASRATVTSPRRRPSTVTGSTTVAVARACGSGTGKATSSRGSSWPSRSHSSAARCGASGATISTSGSTAARGAAPRSRAWPVTAWLSSVSRATATL